MPRPGSRSHLITSDVFLESYSCLRRARERLFGEEHDDGETYEHRFRELQYKRLVQLALSTFAGDGEGATGVGASDVETSTPWEPPADVEAAARELRTRAAEGRPVVGGWVVSGRALAHVPFLVPDTEGGGWVLYTLNPAARAKERHRREAAFTLVCLKDAGITVARVVLLSVDRGYVRQGPVDAGALFQQEDSTVWVARHEQEARERIALLERMEPRGREVMSTSEDPLPVCGHPVSCPVCRLSLGEIPAHHVFTLYRGGERARALFQERILSLTDLPEDAELTRQQQIQIESVREGRPHRDRDRLREFLSGLSYPLSFLDFETYAVAVPPFDGVRPWQHVPFQYSVHRIDAPGAEPLHSGHIEPAGTDGRRMLIATLLEVLGTAGSVVVFGSNFERSMLRYLGELYPEYRDTALLAADRIVDLSVPFQRFDYYHPEQRGRLSLKMILPALTGIDYSGLAFTDGLDASVAYYLSSHAGPEGGVLTEAETDAVRKGLEEYCAMDTMALLRVLEVLCSAAE